MGVGVGVKRPLLCGEHAILVDELVKRGRLCLRTYARLILNTFAVLSCNLLLMLSLLIFLSKIITNHKIIENSYFI